MSFRLNSNIDDDYAKKLFLKLKKAVPDADDIKNHLINDICLIEQMKHRYQEKIDDQGVMIFWENGKSQKGYREHPLLKEIPKLVEQQRKLLNELKLTPASKKNTEIVKAEDEFDEF